MTKNAMKQIDNLIDAINRLYVSWHLKMDKWSENPKNSECPCLAEMIEDRLNHLRGLDEKEAKEFEWMMSL